MGQQNSSEQRLSPFHPSQLCQTCQTLFSGHREVDGMYPHIERLCKLRENVSNGCAFCAWIYSNLKSQSGVPPDPIDLKFRFSSDSRGARRQYPIIYGYVRERHLGSLRFALIPFKDIHHLVPFKGHEIQATTTSAKSRRLARTWLQACVRDHAACRLEQRTGLWYPGRLLDLGVSNAESSEVRLIDTRTQAPRGDYIALSHCWGQSPIFTLCAETEEHLSTGIPPSTLPATFRDAIQVARWFGVEYLWIDSLCIRQDSVEDWLRESQTMKNVYTNALLTIAAAGAKDSSVGCFRPRNPISIETPRVQPSWSGLSSDPFCIVDRNLWKSGIDYSPLLARAWVVQERFLSSRTLYFGEKQMFWECCHYDACETFPVGRHGLFSTPPNNGPKKVRHSGLMHSEIWLTAAQCYSEALLTKASDKLIAISGIAEEMQLLLKDDYLAGLWKRDFGEHLSWRLKQTRQTRPKPYRAPTWSWLSVDGALELNRPWGARMLIEILEVHVDLVDPRHRTGNIRHAFIRINGQLKEAAWHFNAAYSAQDFRRYIVIYDGLEVGIAELESPATRPVSALDFGLDALPDPKSLESELFLLPLTVDESTGRRWNTPDSKSIHGRLMTTSTPGRISGLVLMRRGNEKNEFERIGHFYVKDPKGSKLFLRRLLSDSSFPRTNNDRWEKIPSQLITIF